MDETQMVDESPAPGRRRSRTARTGLVGALVGIGATVGALALVAGGANAQAVSEPVQDDPTMPASPTEEWEAHVACIDNVFEGENGFEARFEALDEADAADAAWEDLEGEIDAAVAECDTLLPPELLAEWEALDEAFAEFDECLVDNGLAEEAYHFEGEEFGDEDWFEAEPGDVVIIESPDGSTFVEFGDGDGEVVITKTDGSINVVTEGEVTSETIDWEELDVEEAVEGFGECEHLLPERQTLDFEEAEPADS